VLLLTHAGDHFTIDRVAAELEARGAHAHRIDTDRFPTELVLSARLGDGGPRHALASDDGALALKSVDDVVGVWARRIWTPRLPDGPEGPGGMDPRLREGAVRESAAAFAGFLDGLGAARWVNVPHADRRAENKARQLRVARDLGLAVPRTLITNDPARARSFFDEVGGRMVAKMLTPLSVSMGKAPLFVRTSLVAAEDLEHADELRLSPMVFQELVPKDVELRVAVVDGRPFVGAIDASRSSAGQVDWRAAATGEVRWEHAELPADVAAKLHRLCRELDLVYGAVDLIRRPDGEHVFLEINPGGEWGMLERDLDLPIAAALADALLDRTPDPNRKP